VQKKANDSKRFEFTFANFPYESAPVDTV